MKGAQDRSAPDEAPTAVLVVGQEARTPMRDAEFRRRRPQRGRHDLAVIEPARTARPGPVDQAADPGLVVSNPPSDHRRARNPGAGSDLGVRQTVGRPRRAGRNSRRPRQRGQFLPVPAPQSQRINSHAQLSQTNTVNHFRHATQEAPCPVQLIEILHEVGPVDEFDHLARRPAYEQPSLPHVAD